MPLSGAQQRARRHFPEPRRSASDDRQLFVAEFARPLHHFVELREFELNARKR
jgi:hypothetical protein